MADRSRKPHSKVPAAYARLNSDIRSLNSGLLIISQKIKYLVRNEKILGRNLIVLNKKIKSLEEKPSAGAAGMGSEDMQIIVQRIEENSRKIAELDAKISELKEGSVSQEKFNELKYVIDSINPLEFATIQQVKDMLAETQKKAKK